MLRVNIHEAKSQLSKLLMKVENNHEVVTLCRNGQPIAEIVPIKSGKDPLKMHKALQGVKYDYNPVAPLTEDEWPGEYL